jgi:hypothetical protein
MRTYAKVVVCLLIILFLFSNNTVSVRYNYQNYEPFHYPPKLEWIKPLSISFDMLFFVYLDQTVDDGFIIAGTNLNDYTDNICLLKTDDKGNEEWNKTYEQKGTVFSVQQTNDNGYVIGGFDNYLNPFIMKIYENSTVEWNKTFHREWIDSKLIMATGNCQQTLDGGYFLAGDLGLTINAIKTDMNGTVEWMKTDPLNYTIFHGKQTPDGSYILVGTTDYPGCGDLWIVRLDNDGDELWNKTIIIDTFDTGTSGGYFIDQTHDEGYILSCIIYDKPWNIIWCWDYPKIIKVDNKGNMLWNLSSGGIPSETDDHGFIYQDDIFNIVKIDANGTMMWSDYNYYVHRIEQIRDKGFIAVSEEFSNDYYNKYNLIKYGPEDRSPPIIRILEPTKGFYVMNKLLFNTKWNTIVFGPMNLTVEAIDNSSGIDHVEVSIGEYPNASIYFITEEPYNITWNQIVFGKYPIEVVAYDKAGNQASYKMEVWKFF